MCGAEATRIVARTMWRRVGGDSKRALLKASGTEVPRESIEHFGDRLIEKANPIELGQMMLRMAIADELMVSTDQPGKAETMLKPADLLCHRREGPFATMSRPIPNPKPPQLGDRTHWSDRSDKSSFLKSIDGAVTTCPTGIGNGLQTGRVL
jgi:hypothetical protein